MKFYEEKINMVVILPLYLPFPLEMLLIGVLSMRRFDQCNLEPYILMAVNGSNLHVLRRKMTHG